MYENAEDELKRILALVETCPEPLRASAFAILLQGFVNQVVRPATETTARREKPANETQVPPPETSLPPELATRFKTTAKRLELPLPSLEALFDFTTEPFTFHAIHVPGADKAEKTRNVALIVAAKSYLTNGAWTADWKEVKAQCVDQNCYDAGNHASTFKKRLDLFKSVEPGKAIELSSGGIKDAEGLLKKLSTGPENAASK